jgi:hypothetical protein
MATYPNDKHPLLEDPDALGRLKNLTINVPPAEVLPVEMRDIATEVKRLIVEETAARQELVALLAGNRLQEVTAADKRHQAEQVRAGKPANAGTPNTDKLRDQITEALARAQGLNAAMHVTADEYATAMRDQAPAALAATQAAYDQAEADYLAAIAALTEVRDHWLVQRQMLTLWQALVTNPNTRPSISGRPGQGAFVANGHTVDNPNIHQLTDDLTTEVNATRRALEGKHTTTTATGFTESAW